MINGNNSYAQSIGTNMQNPEGVFLKEPVPAPDLIEKSITDNGDYSAKADGADGYSSVDVNVANSFTPADEGKVVSDGALVSQTAYPTEITENNTYDTTNYNSITVNVSSGGSGTSFAAVSEFNYNNDYATLLASIEIPDGVESIGDYAFDSCSALTSITIPSSVTSIGVEAFDECQALETVTFESNSSLASIGDGAFHDCYELTSITIPNSVTSMGDYTFQYCQALETVTFEANSSLASIGGSAFESCSLLSSITIPNGVTTIGDGAFSSCSSLSSITIPSSVTTIERVAFSGCENLETVTFESTTPPSLDVDLGIYTSCTIRVPQGTLSAYTSAPNYPDPSEYTYEEY